ncbi:MAG: PilZ domain-containing protein [Phycisphaerales bacterium]
MRLTSGSDRREHPRFALPAMYTAIAARTLDTDAFSMFGHAYDLSEGGMRFEIDQPIEPGTPIVVRISLPGRPLTWAERRPVYAFANLVWVEPEDLEIAAGPIRMACVFRRFVQPGDLQRLQDALSSGRYALAA